MRPAAILESPQVQRALSRWAHLWGVPQLKSRVVIRFSPRLKRSLAKTYPTSQRISLHRALEFAPRKVLIEVLCHEAAHVVVGQQLHAQHRNRPRPHGPEWRQLMRIAGYEPRLAAKCPGTARHLRDIRPSPQPKSRQRVVHICPVCHLQRTAQRVVPQWRCAHCISVGLDGMLEIAGRSVYREESR